MSNWKKTPSPEPLREDSSADTPAEEPMADTTAKEPETPAEELDTPAEELDTPAEDAADTAEKGGARYKRSGFRRGQRRAAALLGFITILLAITGVISLVVFAILGLRLHREELLDDVAYFISPLTSYCPEAFADVNESDQDALLLSALYRISNAEQIRQLQENTAESVYSLDELGRMLVPVETVEASYAVLYGPDAAPYHHTIGEAGLSYTYEYDPDNGVYHIPQEGGNSLYNVVYGDLHRWFGTVTLRVGYVPGALAIDDRGEPVPPAMEDAQIVQVIKLRVIEDGYYIVSVTDVTG